MSKTFCPLPWNSINLRNNGDMRICCNTNSYTPNRGLLKKKDGAYFNAGKDDWNEARNAPLLKEVRATMMKDKWHPECERCRQEEVNGVKSRREYEKEDWVETNVLDNTKKDGTLDTSKQKIEFMDLRYGNFCNLKCRMCGPTDSNKWYDDLAKLQNSDTPTFKDGSSEVTLHKNKKGKLDTDHFNWFKNNNRYWSNFEQYAPNAKKLYIVGGEPLIIPEHQESLQRLVDSGKSKNIEIEYNSNLTMVPNKLISLWEQFKQIRIGVSIDGIDEVFDYQRTPAKFSNVYKNMLSLQNNDRINLKAWFAFTITPYNIFHLPEFMKWKLEKSGLYKFNPISSLRPLITQHMCHSPKYFNIKVLPLDIKNQVWDYFELYKDWIYSTKYSEHVKNNFIKILDGVVKFMMSDDYSKEYLNNFISETKKLDIIRNQDVTKIVPQYKGLFNER